MGGKYYYQADGTLARNKGLKIGGNWYYLTDSGKMHTGWRIRTVIVIIIIVMVIW